MARLCERPGCSQPADVAYGIDPEHLTVWIEVLDPAAPSRPGVLCLRHADAMVVPLRWTLDDRREPVPRLFRSPATVAAPLRERVLRTRAAPPVGAQLELDGGDGASAGGHAEVPEESEHAEVPEESDRVEPAAADVAGQDTPVTEPATTPWRPVFDPEDDLDGLLRARGPLLARAFRRRERRPDSAG
jgi:hypothetical protein